MLLRLFLAASLFVGTFAADKVVVTPWCANSVRVQVQPSGSALKPTPGALKNRVSFRLKCVCVFLLQITEACAGHNAL